MSTFDIAELALLAGLQPSALRHYERLGLLQPAGRVGGRRTYDEQGLRQLAAIDLWKQAGFTLSEMAKLVNDTTGNVEDVRAVAAERIAEIDVLVAEALQVKEFLLGHVLSCQYDRLSQCPHYNAHLDEHAEKIASGQAGRRPRGRARGLRGPGRHSNG